MLLLPYRADELRFAYCYHAYLRWCTHYCRPIAALAGLDRETLQTLVEPHGIHVLECAAGPTELRTLVSLRPEESLAACASKLKGKTSQWLRGVLGTESRALFARGYFACTSGKSERAEVESYLDRQGDHHGYGGRARPPVHVETFPVSAEREAGLRPQHAWPVLQFHLVLATWRRRGVFGPEEARAVTTCWRAAETEGRFALLKVSFVPNHVHVAVRIHSGVAPAELALTVMNAAQEEVGQRFGDALIAAGVERLWQASAYLGSYGDLATPKIQQYLRNWSVGERGA